MFEHILAPLDGSSLAESVLPHLAALGKALPVRLVLLRVLDPQEKGSPGLSVDPFSWQIEKVEAQAYLERLAGQLGESGIQVSYEVIEGRAAESITQYAQAQQVDLVVMSSHGESGISGWNVSSVVQKVILRARCSVMIVRAYQPAPDGGAEACYRRILLPLDGSPRAEIVLPLASSFARPSQATLVAAHIVRTPEMPRRTPPSHEDLDLVRQITERNRAEAQRYLEDLPARVDAAVETHLAVSDNHLASLHELARQENIDLVVLSAHGYSGSNQWAYGSTVVSFIAYGTTPLIVVQDLPPDRMEKNWAETVAQERGDR